MWMGKLRGPSKARFNSEWKVRAKDVKYTAVMLLREIFRSNVPTGYLLPPRALAVGGPEKFSSTDLDLSMIPLSGSAALFTGRSCPHFTNKKLKKHREPSESSEVTQFVSLIKKITFLEGRKFK